MKGILSPTSRRWHEELKSQGIEVEEYVGLYLPQDHPAIQEGVKGEHPSVELLTSSPLQTTSSGQIKQSTPG